MENQIERFRFWHGGIAAASFVATTQLATRDNLQAGHRVAILCFALALPIAAVFVTWPEEHLTMDETPELEPRIRRAEKLCIFSFIAGVVSLFWAVYWPAAIILGLASVVSAHTEGGVIRIQKERRDREAGKVKS